MLRMFWMQYFKQFTDMILWYFYLLILLVFALYVNYVLTCVSKACDSLFADYVYKLSVKNKIRTID